MRHNLTIGERGMLGLGALLGEMIGRDPDSDVRAVFNRVGVEGLLAVTPESDDLRAVQHVVEILGTRAMSFLALFVVASLERLQWSGFFAVQPDQFGDRNLVPIILNLIGEEITTVDPGSLMAEVNARIGSTIRGSH